MVKRSLLCSIEGSKLANMFSRENYSKLWKVKGKIFLDRDPETFKLIIIFLRNGHKLPYI